VMMEVNADAGAAGGPDCDGNESIWFQVNFRIRWRRNGKEFGSDEGSPSSVTHVLRPVGRPWVGCCSSPGWLLLGRFQTLSGYELVMSLFAMSA
jgi:hypothetical protein